MPNAATPGHHEILHWGRSIAPTVYDTHTKKNHQSKMWDVGLGIWSSSERSDRLLNLWGRCHRYFQHFHCHTCIRIVMPTEEHMQMPHNAHGTKDQHGQNKRTGSNVTSQRSMAITISKSIVSSIFCSTLYWLWQM